MPPYGTSRNYGSSPSSRRNAEPPYESKKPVKFKITLYSKGGKKINTWTGTAVRYEDGICKFYNETTGTLVQIIGTVVIE
jgi:hypothetical protein